MKIVLACDSKLPVSTYDDKERIVWWLGKELADAGHQVVLLARKGTACSFAEVLVFNEKKPLHTQIPDDADLVHFQDAPRLPYEGGKPYVITQFENSAAAGNSDPNTVYLSHSHAQLHGGAVFVYPGLDWSEYAAPDLDNKRKWFHFIGTSKRGRNIRGAIDLAGRMDARLHVIGGSRVNFRQGFSIPLSPTARFHGVLSGGGRDALLNASRGMIFPVLWPEPFNVGVIESLYFGCPVFGTPYGSMPELLGKKINNKTLPSIGKVDAYFSDYGCLSVKKAELLEAMKNADDFDRARCHEYAVGKFSARRMAEDYLKLYEKVLNGESLHAEPIVTREWVEQELLAMS